MGFAINISNVKKRHPPNMKTGQIDVLDKSFPPSPQRMKNRNILMWFKYVLTALHVNYMMLFDKDL
jgi:hypothetical protein